MAWWLVQQLVSIAILAVMVTAVCQWLPRRPALQHALWLVVLIKCAVPGWFAWPWSVLDLSGAIALEARAQEVLSTWNRAELTRAPGSDLSNNWSDWLTAVAIVVWVSGAMVLALRRINSLWALSNLIHRAEPAPEELHDSMRRIAAQLAVRAPRALVARQVSTPILSCLGKVSLLWPAELASRDQIARLEGVLAHELAHLARRDHWVAWLALVGDVAWWWNPLWWLARRRVDQYAEVACDALALSLVDEQPRAYADRLLEFSVPSWSAEPALTLSAVAGGQKFFKRRLMMIFVKPAAVRLSWKTFLALALTASFVLPSWSLGQAPAESKPTAKVDVLLPGFYLSESAAAPGLNEMALEKRPDDKIYLHGTPVATIDDVYKLELVHTRGQGSELGVTFKKEGAEKMSKATAQNQGKRLAMVVDGRVVWAPVIRATISDQALVTGNSEDLQALVKVLRAPVVNVLEAK